MVNINYQLLQKLCMLHAVSGDTSETEGFLLSELEKLGIKAKQTGYGTIVFGNLSSPKKLIAGHIDEVGFQITKIEEDGKIRILPVGWVFANRLDHCICYIKTAKGRVRGLILHQEILKTENLNHFGTMFVDVGANSIEEVTKMGIRVGQTGTYQKEYWENNGTIIATALDNKVSTFAMLFVISQNKEFLRDNMFAFITDEEMYDHSANGLGSQFNIDFAVILDFCPVHQKPGEGDIVGEVGRGALVAYRGGIHMLHEKVREYFDKKIKTPFQRGFFSSTTLHQLEPVNFQNNGTTKAVNVCMVGYGYHGAAYSIRKTDMGNYIKLIEEILKTPY